MPRFDENALYEPWSPLPNIQNVRRIEMKVPDAPNKKLLGNPRPVLIFLKHDCQGTRNTACKNTMPSTCFFPHPYLMGLSSQRQPSFSLRQWDLFCRRQNGRRRPHFEGGRFVKGCDWCWEGEDFA